MKKAGRKSANLIPSGKLTNRETVWAQVRALKSFNVAELHTAIKPSLEVDVIQYYLKGWVKAGHIKTQRIDTRGVAYRLQYTLINDTGVHPPIVNIKGEVITKGRSRQQMWNTMRTMSQFTFKEISAFASTDEHIVTELDAADYVSTLHKAGYLHTLEEHSHAGGIRVYTLLPALNTGPKPPLVQRTKVVIDQNLRKIVYPKAEEINGDY